MSYESMHISVCRYCGYNQDHCICAKETLNKALSWAKKFKESYRCETCPFVIDEVDVGVGMMRNCDHVCDWEPEEIAKEAILVGTV